MTIPTRIHFDRVQFHFFLTVLLGFSRFCLCTKKLRCLNINNISHVCISFVWFSLSAMFPSRKLLQIVLSPVFFFAVLLRFKFKPGSRSSFNCTADRVAGISIINKAVHWVLFPLTCEWRHQHIPAAHDLGLCLYISCSNLKYYFLRSTVFLLTKPSFSWRTYLKYPQKGI